MMIYIFGPDIISMDVHVISVCLYNITSQIDMLY